MKNKTISLVALTLAVAPFTAFAQEAAPAQEASSEKQLVIKLPEVPLPENVEVKLSGMVQAQFVAANASGGNASDQNGFSVRRTTLGATAKVGGDWSARLVYEIDSGNKGGSDYNDYIDTAIISRKFDDVGTLIVGHKKTHFMHEEYSPSSKFLCLERSLNSNFVSGDKYAKGLAGYHIGVFWEGKVGNEIDYGISLTNAVAKDYNTKSNDLAVTGNVGYTLKMDGDQTLYFGLNGTINFGDDPGVSSNTGTVYGIEPYVQYTCGGFTALADAYYIDGESAAHIDAFWGVNLTAAYRFENGFEPAVRFTYLNTDSMAVNANTQNRVPASGNHNNATTYYVGVNYYFNKYVKLACGYEYGHYFGGGAHADDSGAFRSMLQLAF